MPKQVFVTSAQKAAAQAVVKRSTAKGQGVSLAVRKIANASAKAFPVKQSVR